MTYHPTITPERVYTAMEEQMYGTANPGFCLACGEDHDGCEPDAEGYHCDCCGADQVMGAEAFFLRYGG